MAVSRLQSELASRSRLEDELSEFPAQQLAARCALGDTKAPLRITAPSCWINHDLPTTRRSPCAERASGRSPPMRQTPTCAGVFGSSSAAASPRPL